ncbi:glycosyltransferase family 2 protein [Carboxylicivirga mesophila]|uniref:Glycosyltransferase family 2 protein n=1 Tax=Carboxylicivirga mesophila TaxID=1166478 RepID=A0ABS5KAR6_9BACT|nr:glycosyltransferase family 2 protein [Carboxylicivirga mesophila]MBS2212124.1 glycosyltransferase family 2 protein [Carboxylicivirga mesophila]
MKPEPLVSILIPLYNSERYISETIQSCLSQTYRNIEIIIVDDGSTDSSYTIAKKYESWQVRVFKQVNSGACAARNLAFEHCKGDYIQYLDADDILSPNKIEDQLRLIADKDNAVASCSWQYFKQSIGDKKTPGQIIDKDYLNPVNWLIDSWNGKGMAQTACWLTPRSLIEKAGPWNETLKINQDGEFFCRVLLNASRIKFSVNGMVYYRIGLSHSVSRTNSYEKLSSQLYSFKLYEEHLYEKYNELTVDLKNALHCVFSDYYIRTILSYPDLAEQSLINIKSLGFNFIKPQGGKYFKLACTLIGLKATLKLRNWIQQA